MQIIVAETGTTSQSIDWDFEWSSRCSYTKVTWKQSGRWRDDLLCFNEEKKRPQRFRSSRVALKTEYPGRWTRLLRRPGFLMFSPYTHYFMEAVQWQHLHCILPPKIIIHMTASDNSFTIFRVLWNILIINAEQSIGTLDRNTSVTPVKQITFNRSCWQSCTQSVPLPHYRQMHRQRWSTSPSTRRASSEWVQL